MMGWYISGSFEVFDKNEWFVFIAQLNFGALVTSNSGQQRISHIPSLVLIWMPPFVQADFRSLAM